MPKLTSTKKATKRVIRSGDVIYQVLMECADIVQDDFWRQFYKDMSSGKGTRGIYISNGIIKTSNKRGGFSYSITDKAPEVIIRELHYLLTTHTSICSRKDINKKLKLLEELEEELNQYDQSKWTSIKRKNIRNMLIVNYIIHLKCLHGFTWSKAENAFKVIMNAFESKTHSSKDIEYSDGKITDINGFEYDSECNCMINTRTVDDESADANEEYTLIQLQDLFEPYVQSWMKATKSNCN